MAQQGWKRLLADHAWFHGANHYPIVAYSEFMPPPRLGKKPYGRLDTSLFDDADPWGWHVSEYERAAELEPGARLLAREIVGALRHLGRGEPAHGIAEHKLDGNPYWPDELRIAHAPASERYVVLLPLALSRTQDDKGRVRWTLFGGSEQGPSQAFWKSFFVSPREERPIEFALDFVRRLLHSAYGVPLESLGDLAGAGFRILPYRNLAQRPRWPKERLPHWTAPYLWQQRNSLVNVKYLLTFCPFAELPRAVRRRYLAGELALLPFPGSLVFWGAGPYFRLSERLPLAMQIPLLHSFERHAAPGGIRVPQSGWMHEPREESHVHLGPQGPLRNLYRRTHRWARIHRDEDELAVSGGEDHVAHVLFSAAADDLGLYGKPMARNSQIWSHDCQLVLDGPWASHHELVAAAKALASGGLFGYRFLFPAMRVGEHEVYWHWPLVAHLDPTTDEPRVLEGALSGYLTGYRANQPRLARPVELWPRQLAREPYEIAARLLPNNHDPAEARQRHVDAISIRKLLDTRVLWGQPLESSFARALLTAGKDVTLEAWLDMVSKSIAPPDDARRLHSHLCDCIEPKRHDRQPAPAIEPLTFARTATRAFEKAYWNAIAYLSTGRYVNKDNADCVTDSVTQARLAHDHRDLEALGDYLLKYYRQLIADRGMTGRALATELPFRWRTDFDYRWQGGWLRNQLGQTYERDLVMMIPGRDRSRAVIMADHYDTAYMEDEYGADQGGGGPRLSSAGADDNHSATAALMLGAPVFMERAASRLLACDVWLVHLTGEEFPSDCMGARHLCQRIVEGSLRLQVHQSRGLREKDFSKVTIQGVYVLDMIAHNSDRNRDTFQICPGMSRESMGLAYQAHLAARTWNELTPQWNSRPARRRRGRGKRSADAKSLPAIAEFPYLNGEVRPSYDPRSTLYNTDGQIFSDAGVPVALLMENYDINRKGYHDTQDTLANIDLDYGAAMAAIAIESVARAASEPTMTKATD